MAPPVRTQAQKLEEAIRFVWGAADRVIPTYTADQIAQMKGVNGRGDIASIAEALGQRQGRLS